ncbi:Ig-like domain repeat protein [Aeromicrobium massiliense]|uniref:Ig-like domain repeat protein n=1 Tax=Aeromicrobium massiliense TaxID=1464554 RepID=UPI0011C8E845|nr:Ig-like domain repeat protein [Aeromicrobium massiliense]
MSYRSFLPFALAAGLLAPALSVTGASAAPTGQLDVVLTSLGGDLAPELGASLYRDGVRPDGRRLVEKVATCTPVAAEGVCRFTGVPEGKYIVDTGGWQNSDGSTRTFFKAGTRGVIDGFSASAISVRDETITTVAIQRQPGLTISGAVTDRDGKPVAGAEVQVLASTPFSVTPVPMVAEKTDADGRYISRGLGGSAHKVLVKPTAQEQMATWYGDTTDEAKAHELSGASGESKRADVKVRTETTLIVPVTSAEPVQVLAYQRTTSDDGVESWEVAGRATKTTPGTVWNLKLALPRGGWYRIRVANLDGSRSVWFNQASSLSDTDDVHVDDQVRSGIDVINFDAVVRPRAASTTTVTAPVQALVGQQILIQADLETTGQTTNQVRFDVLDGDKWVGLILPKAGGDPALLHIFDTPGRHVIRARYQGSAGARSSYSAPVTVMVKAPSTLAAAAAPMTAGRAGSVQVKVVADGEATGEVTVREGTTVLGVKRLTAADRGQTSIALRPLAAGARTLTVSYSGTDLVAAASTSVPVNVARATPTVRATAPSAFKAGVGGTLNVTIAAPGLVPTGRVTVRHGSTVVGSVILGAAGRGSVRVPVRALPAGTKNLGIEYAGSSAIVPRTTSVPVRVVKSPASIQARPAGSLKSSGGRLAVTIRAALPATGSVTVKDGARIVGRGNLASAAKGRITLKLVKLTKGRRTFTIFYAGDSRTLAATARTAVSVRK